MTRRSPLHQRYQAKKPKGATSHSAARAKPKREAGEAADRPAKPKRPNPAMPQTPEARRLRRIWWVLVASALALAFASVFVKSTVPWLWWPLMIAYALTLGGAMYLEFVPLRRMRKEAEDEARRSDKASGKRGGSNKPINPR